MRRPVCLLLALTLAASALPATEAAGILDVTLIAPAAVIHGGRASLGGVVSFADRAIPLLDVDLIEDGRVIARSTTGTDGRYAFSVAHAERGVHAYRVVARAPADAESTSSIMRVSWAVAPGAPGTPVLTPLADAQSYDATWSGPVDDGGSPAIQRRVYLAPDAEGPWSLLEMPSARTVRLSDLGWDREYALRVTDVNIAGEGASSNVLSLRTPPAQAPAAPRGLAASFDPEDGHVTLTWDAPDAMGNGAPQGYVVDRSRNGGVFGADTVVGVETRTLTFALTWGSTYDIRLRAKTSAGLGEAAVVGIVIPIRDGFTLDVPRTSICQEWPGHLICGPIRDGETRSVYAATTRLAVVIEGDLFEANAPLVGETVGLASDIAYGTATQTRAHSVKTDVYGHWSTESPAFTVPQLAPGACETYTTSSTGMANGWTDGGRIAFTLCSSGDPPP